MDQYFELEKGSPPLYNESETIHNTPTMGLKNYHRFLTFCIAGYLSTNLFFTAWTYQSTNDNAALIINAMPTVSFFLSLELFAAYILESCGLYDDDAGQVKKGMGLAFFLVSIILLLAALGGHIATALMGVNKICPQPPK